MKSKNALFATIASLLIVSSTLASTISWTGGTALDASGSWNGTTSTFNGQAYTASDDLFIDGTATKTITLSGTIPNPASLTISGTGVASGTASPGTGAITLTGTSVGGALNKTGSADLVLASANAFGAVTISSGKFFLNNAAGLGTTGALTVNSGTTSGVTGSYSAGTAGLFFYDSTNINADVVFSKDMAFGTVASATTYGMVMRGGATRTTTFSGNITGGSNVTLWLDTNSSGDGSSIWKLSGDNSGFTGTVRLNRGRLFLENANASGVGALFIQSNGGSGVNGTVVFDFSGTINNTTITLNSGGSGINYLSTGTNNVTITGNVVGSGGLGKSGTGTLTLTNTTNGLGSATTIADGTLSIGGAGRLNSGTYASAITLTAATSVFDYASSASQTLSGLISGLGKITKSGTSTLTLSGAVANTYTGGTTINGGTLGLASNGSASTGDITVGSGAAYGTSYSSGGTPFLKNTVTGLNIANNLVLSTTAGYYALQMGAGAGGTVEWSGVISGGGAGVVLQIDTPNAGGDSTSATTLSNSNTFAGQIRLNRGVLVLANANALGTASLFLQTNGNSSGNLRFATGITNISNDIVIGTTANQAISTANGDVTLSGTVSNSAGNTSGGVSKVGSGTLTLTGVANALTGPTRIEAGTLSIGGSGRLNAGAYSGSTTILDGGTFNYASSANQTISGVITGAGSVTKSGSSTLTLSGNNTYTGTTTANAGTVIVSGKISGSATTVNAGATMLVTGAGSIAGSTVAVKAGGIFGGNANINDSGTGQISSAISVEDGGTLLVGNGTSVVGDGVNGVDGLVVNGDLNLNSTSSNSVIRLTLGGAISGNPQEVLGSGKNHAILFKLGGAWTFNLNQKFSFAGTEAGFYDNIMFGLDGSETNLITSGSTAWNFSDANFSYSFAYDDAGGLDLSVVAVPEPGSLISLLGGLGVIVGFRRRRR